MVAIKKFNIVSIGKFFAKIGAIVGIIMGIYFAAIAPVGLLPKATVFLMVLIGSIIGGFLEGAILGIIYNLVSAKLGLIEAEV